MKIVTEVLATAVSLFMMILLVRLVLDWIQVFVRDWRPRGLVLVVAEATYTVTYPPLRVLRRVIPPIAFGGMRFDVAFLLLMLLCGAIMGILARI